MTGETILATDDGSLGEKGFVTQALARRLAAGAAYARVYACGPMPMFAALPKVVAPAWIRRSSRPRRRWAAASARASAA